VFTATRIKISYVRLKNLLVISLGDLAAQKSVDTYTKDRRSLSEDPKFIEARKHSVESPDIISYWDMEEFFQFMKEQVNVIVSWIPKDAENNQTNKIERQLEEALKTVAGFKNLSFSANLDSFSEFKVSMFLDPSNISADLTNYYLCNSVKNETLGFTPQGVLGYQWNTCINLEYYWDQLIGEVAKAGDSDEGTKVADQIKQFEAALGLSVESDILPAFGDEFGGYLSDIQVGGMFPIPKFLLFVKVNDQSKVETILTTLTKNPLFLLQNESYSGININYFSSPLGGEDLQPSYCFLGDYLLIAINKNVIKSSIDANNDQAKSLLSDEAFKEVDKGLTDPNMSIYFARMGAFVNKIEGMIEWANNWAGAQDQKRTAFKAGSEQRLKDVESDITEAEGEIKAMMAEVRGINEKIAEFETQGLDATASQEELKITEASIEEKKKDADALIEQKLELVEIIKGYEKNTMSAETRKLFLNEFVYPLLTGISSIETFGGRTTIENDIFESTVMFKFND